MTLSVRFAVTGLTVLLLAACGGSESSPANGGAGGSSGGAGSSAAGGSTGSGGTSVGAGGTMPGGAGGTGPGGIGQCVETTSAIAADMTSSLGFSANDVLAIVGGAHPSDLAWVASDLYATHTRALTQTPLTLTLGSQPSAVRFIDSQGGGCPGPGLGVACIVCMKRMEIDIDVTLVTGDGALNEKLSVTLKTTTKSAPSFSTNVASGEVVGDYLTGVMPKMGYELAGIHVEAGYGVSFPGSRMTVPNQWNGFVAALVTMMGAPLTSSIMQAHGYFPRQTAGLK